MSIRSDRKRLTRWTTALALVAAIVTAAGWRTSVHAQLPLQPVGSVFEMTGFIQAATLDTGTDPFRGGTITLNNHVVVVPKNTIFQMPATSLTWAELFTNAPAAYRASGQTGLALTDTPKPFTTFEVTVQGNRIEQAQGAFPAGTYVAGLLFLDQLSLQTHQGFINFIDYSLGELRVGGAISAAGCVQSATNTVAGGPNCTGTRVRLNDPIGRFGRVMTHDIRFTIDEDNPTVKTETGFPLCIPRVDPSILDDPLCPFGNRPMAGGIPQTIFVMPGRVAPTAALTTAAAVSPLSAATAAALNARAVPDPWRMAPFMVGDYVTVKGPLVADPANPSRHFISAWGVDANVGIFTTPGTLPAYVAIDVLLMGTGPTIGDVANLAQEAARRMRVEGFTTDITRTISVNAVDVDACTGAETDRNWTFEAVDQGPPTGAVPGRWRFRPGAPLFNLKGFPFLPPTREAHAFVFRTDLAGNAVPDTVTTLNGLSAGEYQAPNFEFIGPENLGIGNPKVPFNFDTMEFLAQGSGPRAQFGSGANLGVVRQLSPWPGQTVPTLIACPVPPIANAGANQTVASGALAALNGSASSDPNTPALPLTFQWTQTGGPAVAITNPTGAIAGFRAPTGPATLTFQLAVNNTKFTSTATTRVTVNAPPADATAPTFTAAVSIAPSSTTAAGFVGVRSVATGAIETVAASATDNVGVVSVTFTVTNLLTLNTIAVVPGPGPAFSATLNTTGLARGLLNPHLLTATARDAAGNVRTSTITFFVR